MTASLLSTLIAMSAAFLFALSAQIQNVGLATDDTRIGTLVVVGATTAFFWLAAPFVVRLDYLATTATLLFAATGIVQPTLTMTLWVEGIKRLGPTLNAGLSAVAPIFSATFAILLLGEVMTWPVALGTAAVTSGVVVAALRGQNTISHFPAWAVLLPLAAAFGRSLTHTVTKIGYAEVPSPFFASLVGITVGFLLLAIHYKWKRYPLNLRGPGIKYFIGAGAVNTFALYLLNTALAVGKLITVAPVLALSPIFAMLMGLLIFRREQFTWRTFVTIALVVPGVILITLRG
ncbi:MAG: DMT family transporter [Hyphomicrobiaceae bacterium]|nr:DMT family transporter [Hyphomicrobiaceae bacterium]